MRYTEADARKSIEIAEKATPAESWKAELCGEKFTDVHAFREYDADFVLHSRTALPAAANRVIELEAEAEAAERELARVRPVVEAAERHIRSLKFPFLECCDLAHAMTVYEAAKEADRG